MPDTIQVSRFEEAALLKVRGARLIKTGLVKGRVVLTFEVSSSSGESLDRFRAGQGPQGNLAEFALALTWAKDLVFSTRRGWEA